MRGRKIVLTLAMAALLGTPAVAAPPRPVEFPPPQLAVTVAPVPPGLERPRLDPPPAPPIPAPALDLGRAPAPRFISSVTKPLPTTTDPGGFACAFVAFRRAVALTECGMARVSSGNYREAREAFEESIAIDPRGAQAATAYIWLGELALLEATGTASPAASRAERAYLAGLPLAPPPPLVPHAEVGLGLLALRRGAAAEAEASLERALNATPPQPLALVARYLLGVARLLQDRPAEAVALWDEIVQSGASGAILTELQFWRGVALARLGDPNGALDLLNQFATTTPVNHPLRGDALVQAGWIALERNAGDVAVKRFLEADATNPRPELRAQIRAGLVRAYLAVGDTGRAAAAARQLKAESSRDPLVPAALLLIADAAKARGAQNEATDIYREILLLPLPPTTQDYVRYRLGEQLEHEGRLLEAKDHYRELRDKGREEAVAQRATYRLGLVALRENDTASARREGEALLRAGILPELREGALLLVAESAARGDDPNRAAAVLRTALRDYPDSPLAARTRLALGWALLRDGDAESAIREWREAATKADLETQALALLAVADVALRQGREAEALEALRGVAAPPPGLRNADALLLNRGILALRTQGLRGRHPDPRAARAAHRGPADAGARAPGARGRPLPARPLRPGRATVPPRRGRGAAGAVELARRGPVRARPEPPRGSGGRAPAGALRRDRRGHVGLVRSRPRVGAARGSGRVPRAGDQLRRPLPEALGQSRRFCTGLPTARSSGTTFARRRPGPSGSSGTMPPATTARMRCSSSPLRPGRVPTSPGRPTAIS